ncbi:TetR/AcrR family transcriptional regulator [Kineococcus rhizosphaerae]|uniref:TetR family transcriptional regulator n=1 Tax=Kineococcus rhizosphaerae TaxID=559628 RepID=A0A2T0R1A1_9ACTN|nr:TetR/AcrR family transcriptional regulator [Kineococcus rhizosphaerae]PRY13349.1 TetR family transcriptional regulator [Kineococcus rhizosphaerae]
MTKEEIDEEILDAAAALFARHGVEQTSVQRIADAVGYSKTGLLHRFPSKDALQDATVAHTVDALRALAQDVDGVPVGAARDRRVVEALADLTTRRPGLVAFALTALSGQEGAMGPDRLEAIGEALFGAFGEQLTAGPPDDRGVRITTAVGGLAVASLACADLPFDRVRPHLVAAALGALGHPAPTEEN